MIKSRILLSITLTFLTFKTIAQLPLGTELFGKGSYYGKEFYGNKTTSGERLKPDDMTCAHRTLPFGTMIEVTNLQNNKWCVVRVNDRGPFVGDRIIDVSEAAATELSMKGAGVVRVKLTIVGDNGTVYIGHPTSIVENSQEILQSDSSKNVEIPLKPEPKELKKKPAKDIAKKRANRRRNR
jgi:rare lipoprotein A